MDDPESPTPVLHCPACGYSLDGLPAVATCPECGARYSKPEISLRPRRRWRLWQRVLAPMPVVAIAYLWTGLATLERSYGGFVLSLLFQHILQVVLILNLLAQLIFTGWRADRISRDLQSSGRQPPAWANPTAIGGVIAFVALNYWLLGRLAAQLN